MIKSGLIKNPPSIKNKPSSKLLPLLDKGAKKEQYSEFFYDALEYVKQWHNLNLTVIPEKPSEKMLLAGAKAGDMSIQTTYRVFQAMLTMYQTENLESLDKRHKTYDIVSKEERNS